ncbi:DNA polymerase III subunit alpha [Micromonospora craniellae]|uniref:DNA polymerase III subunit alpha n=1 Tax=Micromonospora craniellae TaxID=2294034 RepID=A0A372FXI0_9ACTN|nr:DNA polymerase III subunit alpha [Micromonospora craniellae]QOC92633.1 DNA polymerase III subunit alpha [Micromonospora craniellae]RFS45169.1 DNA polymerase III subunit alpha [Micromonospora craniellae]
MGDSFAHLHVHTEYSMLDGAARLKDLFAEVKRQGMPAVAMTDHGNMHGANDFYKQAMAAGVTPILGIEAYVAPESRYHKKRVRWGRPEQKSDDVSGSGGYTHKTIWARNKTGLHNLFTLTSKAYTEGYFVKWPRMDAELLAEYADGLMATTGCPSGEVQTRLRLGHDAQALEAAAKYQDIFGKENYFLELMDHGLDIEKKVRDGLVEIGRKLNIPPVVTNDSHYTHEAQSEAHDVLLCVQTGSNVADPNRFKFGGSGYYIKSADEMRGVDGSDVWLEGCRNTLLVAERVDPAGMFEFRNLMPRFPVPEGETEESWFRKETFAGLARRYPQGIPEGHVVQAEYELGVIIQMGFPSYFLVVADFIQWAKNQGIAVGPGRGSAAGSLVAYAMGITDLDPIPHGLIFERFLNPERVSMPDVDIDFDERRRGEVIKYVTDKWGEDKVAQIATFGTIKAKAAIKDSARVLGYPYAVGDRITKAMPPAVMGKDIPLEGIFDPKHPRYAEAGEIRGMYESEADVKKVIDTARGIEGLIRQTGVHAAGVIMSAEPIVDHIPLMRRDSDGVIITQFDYPTCESLGLLKMDFLGLRNLTIIDDAVKNIELNHGKELDLLALPLDDKAAYELLARGDTLGVFQLDGGPMRSLLRMMKPDNFEDISAVLALYRPGPMGVDSHTNYALRKNGLQEITPIHPELEEPLREILAPTYGLIVYQEQVQRAAQILAGYTLGQADLLRRAMGKKKKEILDKEFGPFRDGCREHGYSDEATQKVWDVLVPFAGYAFNKAHSAAYGLVSYWTAYLKAHYPAEYMAALLTSVGDDKDKMAMYLSECRRMGIQVLPPDVNTSAGPFTPVGKEIRFGLGAIRNVGANVVASIMRCRDEKSEYADFYDFLSKVDAVVCNKKTIESLIKAGAFDSLKHSRKALLTVHADAIDAYADVKRKEAVGQYDLFGSGFGDTETATTTTVMPVISDGEWDKRDKLAFEREMLGLYVSDHPLFGLEHVLNAAADCTIATLSEEGTVPDGAVVTLAGILSGVQRRVTKQGRAWASATLEDLAGGVEALFFPNTYEVIGQYIAEDAIVVVKGRIDRRDDTPRIMAMDMQLPDVSSNPASKPVTLTIPVNRLTPPLADRLKETLLLHPGDTEVHVKLHRSGRVETWRLGLFRVAPTTALMGDLKSVLGPANVS